MGQCFANEIHTQTHAEQRGSRVGHSARTMPAFCSTTAYRTATVGHSLTDAFAITSSNALRAASINSGRTCK